MFVEDKSTNQEDLKILLPGNIKKEIPPYTPSSEAMTQIQNSLKKRIEDDIALRSNFEFSCENKNIIQEKNFQKIIQTGISILRSKGVINAEIEKTIRNNLNLTI